MFNRLPKHILMISSCSVDQFKSQLDKHLRNIADLPCQPVWILQQSRWWRLPKLRPLRGCQLDATKQEQVKYVYGTSLFYVCCSDCGKVCCVSGHC